MAGANGRRGRLFLMSVLVLLVAVAVVESPKLVTSAESALAAKYDATQAKAVQRNPPYPACSGNITMFQGEDPYSDSAGGPVDLTTVVAGGAYLQLFRSGDPTAPWGIAMFQNGSDDEVKWDGSAWVLPGDPNYGTASPFAEKGQAYGLYSGGFLHDSEPANFGTFFLIGQSWPGADTLTYTPDPASNDCIAARFVATESAMDGGGAAPAPAPMWTLTYEANGGTCASSSGSGANGSWLTLPASCTRPGYEFVGWNTSVNGTGLGFAPGGATLMSGDNTLYAQWRLAAKPSASPTPSPDPSSTASSSSTSTSTTSSTTGGRTSKSISVWFGPGSADLTPKARKKLRRLVQSTGRDATSVQVVGYVQRSGSSANDEALSAARARVVAAYLRSLGLLGAYTVGGDGVAGADPVARRADVTISRG